MNERLGVAGYLARKFLFSEITPLIALSALLLGFFAVAITPREEEPQINVTFANVLVPFPGAAAREVEELISTPAEQVFSEIEGVKHIYSVSHPGMAVLTVEFDVGEDRTRSIVRLYNAVFSNQDWLPQNLGVGQPIIKPKGIDDVPIVTLTLWTDEQDSSAYELQQVAHAIEAELKRVPGTRNVYTVGGPDRAVRILLDPTRMAAHQIAYNDLRRTLLAANVSRDAGVLTADNREIQLRAGGLLGSVEEIEGLVVGVRNNIPVYLRDVAEVKLGASESKRYAWFGTGPSAPQKGIDLKGEFPAVTLAVAKKPGANAVVIADTIIQRMDDLKGLFIPEGVQVTVTRNYGETANDKSVKLITKLAFATLSVVVLVLFALGRREALIVGVAVIITLALTLFASWAWGFTINRVSLFALIFSIGILVDDAIVVVENIHRHRSLGQASFADAIVLAVDEVGGPTILATFTVIAALLPMAFVSGLMGPYMSPIPINASMGMVISLLVAFIVTPWLCRKLLHGHGAVHAHEEGGTGALQSFFSRILDPFLCGAKSRRNRWLLLAVTGLLIAVSVSLVAFKVVVMKMLPFDNKSELQIVVDMPEGVSLERTAQVLSEVGNYLAQVPEVTDYQAYAGTASPINFNGLVRQYYLREGTHVGDIQVNLVKKSERTRKSHDIALAVRNSVQAIGSRHGATIKIVEVPPGPPVQAPLVAEIYGLDYAGQVEIARRVRTVFENTTGVVDVDDSIEFPAQRLILHVDRVKAALYGITQEEIVTVIAAAIGGDDVSYLHDASVKYPLPLRLELPRQDKADPRFLYGLKLHNRHGKMISLSELVTIETSQREQAIYHKDLLPVVFVTGDVAGGLDSPLYGLFDIRSSLRDLPVEHDVGLDQYLFKLPDNPYRYTLKWDGEWQVTYDTFRDMGIAYGVGLILIYLLVVAQFRSYLVPLVIMAPIPLTLIGVMPGHMLAGAQFTATSMIGMIALAGIIVRNSILLVDFINDELRKGSPFEQAVVRAAAVRARPIALTAFAAMLGGFFILDDPIFNGLAVSLIFGVFISTVLTLVIIPVMYFAFFAGKRQRQ